MAEALTADDITHRRVLTIALPIVVSSLSTPLLGLVDTAIIGRLPDPANLAGIALGAMVFSFVYWAFGFLRMGTTGLTAQAWGACDEVEMRAALGRALLIAVSVGAALWALQVPIGWAALRLVEGSADAEAHARTYFDVRIWSAPFTLANYALLGWFIGQGRAGTALLLQLILNTLNIVLDVWFVVGLEWGVAGVAAGTVIAESVAAVCGLVLAAFQLRRIGGAWDLARLKDAAALRRTILVNTDIMLRSLCLIFALAWFTAQGARAGDIVLAANAVLMQFVLASAIFLDGFAFAAEALVGGALGARSRAGLRKAMLYSTEWAAGTALAVTLVLFVGGNVFVAELTTDPEVQSAARSYLPWAAIAPLAGVWCFQLDGIFIGATHTAEMRNAMFASLLAYLAVWWALTPFGNTGLWAALIFFFLIRAVSLGAYLPRLLRAVEPAAA